MAASNEVTPAQRLRRLSLPDAPLSIDVSINRVGARFCAVVLSGAETFDATPFDVEDSFRSHRGTGCTFDTMQDNLGSGSGALDQLAVARRAADTGKLASNPQSAGVLAMSVVLSRQFHCDHAQRDAGLPLYDALCRWPSDGQNKTHSWPETKAR